MLVGPSRAKCFLMTGARVDAVEAERTGLVSFVVDDDEAVDDVEAVAAFNAKRPPRFR